MPEEKEREKEKERRKGRGKKVVTFSHVNNAPPLLAAIITVSSRAGYAWCFVRPRLHQ